jgi:hypothetical protein
MSRDHYGTATIVGLIFGCLVALGVLMAERPCLDCPILRTSDTPAITHEVTP